MDLFEDQETRWAREIQESSARVYWRIRQAVDIRVKKKRKALYQDWRKEFGDDIARESARLTEATMAGTFDINKLWLKIKSK